MKNEKHYPDARKNSGQLIQKLIVTCSVLVLSAVVSLPGKADTDSNRFEFALIGDMPYNAAQEKEFAVLMKNLDQAELAFVIHDGDFWFDGLAWNENSKGFPPCSDETFENRIRIVREFRHPFIFVPGDNDWTDCHRATTEPYNPLERLDKLRKTFFQGDNSLGKKSLRLIRQSQDKNFPEYRENVRWIYSDVLFVTLHMVGSNNNLGRTDEMDEEFNRRNTANLTWLQAAFAEARKNGNSGVMIIAQANPQFENRWPRKLQKRYLLKGLDLDPPDFNRETGFDEFLEVLEEETLAFGKPVVYVHGDTHTFRIDKPLVGSTSRRAIENFTRVETFGYPDTHWIRAIVDSGDPNVFSFSQEIVKENIVQHRQ